MTKAELIAKVALEADMSKKDAEQAVAAVFAALTEAMKAGDKVSISGFGTFEVHERAAHPGVNPRTKEAIIIEASRTVAFKASKSLKEQL